MTDKRPGFTAPFHLLGHEAEALKRYLDDGAQVEAVTHSFALGKHTIDARLLIPRGLMTATEAAERERLGRLRSLTLVHVQNLSADAIRNRAQDFKIMPGKVMHVSNPEPDDAGFVWRRPRRSWIDPVRDGLDNSEFIIDRKAEQSYQPQFIDWATEAPTPEKDMKRKGKAAKAKKNKLEASSKTVQAAVAGAYAMLATRAAQRAMEVIGSAIYSAADADKHLHTANRFMQEVEVWLVRAGAQATGFNFKKPEVR